MVWAYQVVKDRVGELEFIKEILKRDHINTGIWFVRVCGLSKRSNLRHW